jgi:hypothetical protein
MTDDRPGPHREFWIGLGWALLIICGTVLLIAAGFEIWGW